MANISCFWSQQLFTSPFIWRKLPWASWVWLTAKETTKLYQKCPKVSNVLTFPLLSRSCSLRDFAGIEVRASHMLGKCLTTEPHLQSYFLISFPCFLPSFLLSWLLVLGFWYCVMDLWRKRPLPNNLNLILRIHSKGWPPYLLWHVYACTHTCIMHAHTCMHLPTYTHTNTIITKFSKLQQ